MASASAGYGSIAVSPVSGALGAEVSGIDLRQPLDDQTFGELHRAWMEHQVLFFRDQDLTRDQHKALGQRFGALHIHPYLQPLKDEGHPEFVVLESDADHPFVAGGWHSDVTFEASPPMGSILRCVEAPPFGGDTLWASMYAAHDALSDAMQHLIADLVAIHDTSATFSRSGYARTARGRQAENLASAEHPVVRTHPQTGRKALFVNSAFTSGIKGMKSGESAALLGFLLRHLESPDFSCRLRWQKNSIAMWDNRCTQHRVLADNLRAHRRMERITIQGDRPF
jgi:taurine dioxygenase